jgi:predicted nucleic-acid-binding protein
MIGVDTNVLVRAYLEDDKEQAKEAQEFFKKATKENTLFISSYAILEFVWVLKVKGYNRKEIHKAVISLTDSYGVIISQQDIVLEAITKYLNGKADFGDYMILVDGKRNKTHKLKTFDMVLQRELKNA